ncbi:MAG TPA: hypothetical protein VGM86_18645 [Thermoanaerobaculia bacterium]|jgi:hypothetical protein
MTEAVMAAQAALRGIVRDLEAIRSRLLEEIARLKTPAQEAAPSPGEEEMDLAAELCSTLECVLHDSLQPAIRDLSAAVERE